MSLFENFSKLQRAAGSGVVTRSELDQLREQRRKALVTYVLTPGGMQTDGTLKDRHREDRIRHIADALAQDQGRAVTDFSLGGMRGKARTDFDRER